MHLQRSYLIPVKVLALLLCMTACAPKGGTQATIHNTQQLSASAIAFSKALSSLIDTTIDLLIQDNNTQLLKQYDLLKGMTDEATRKQMLQGFISDQNKALVKQLDALREYNVQLGFLKNYFENLQALANADVGNDTADAVAQLAGNIDAFNNKLRERPSSASLPQDEATAIGGLSGLVVENIRARKLQQALKRDATIIDSYLKNQNAMLDILAGILKASSDRLTDKQQQKVVQAYVNVKISDPSDWQQARRQVLLAQFSSAAITSARDASQELQRVWLNILRGEDDLNSISAFLTNLDKFVEQANQIKTTDQQRRKNQKQEASDG